MESISIISIISACGGLAYRIGAALKALDELKTRFKKADEDIARLSDRLNRINETLSRLHNLLATTKVSEELKEKIAETLQRSENIIILLQARADRFQGRTGILKFSLRGGSPWSGNAAAEYETRLDSQIQAFDLLVGLVQLKSHDEQNEAMASAQSETVLRELAENSLLEEPSWDSASTITKVNHEEEKDMEKTVDPEDNESVRSPKPDPKVPLWEESPNQLFVDFENAISSRNLDRVKLLVDRGADVNAVFARSSESPIHRAASNNDADTLRFLLSKGADVQKRADWKTTALHSAAQRGNAEICKILLSYGLDIESKNQWGNTPLGLAAGFGNQDVFYYLIGRGADIWATNGVRDTILHDAAGGSDSELCSYLASRGLSITAKNSLGYTPLHVAIGPAIEQLISLGSDIGATDNKKRSPLHHAAERADASGVAVYLRQGVPVDATDCDGKTPLYLLCANALPNALLDVLETAKVLLEAGADPNTKPAPLHGLLQDPTTYSRGWTTPVDGAYAGRLRDIVKAFERYGASMDVKNEQGQRLRDVVAAKLGPSAAPVKQLCDEA